MPSKLIANSLLKEINKAAALALRMELSIKDATRRLDEAHSQVVTLLNHAAANNILLVKNTDTGCYSLEQPVYGWDEELAMEHRSI